MKTNYEKELEEIFNKLKCCYNKEDLELFYNNYNKLVFKIAFTILKNAEDSEDIVQVVFSKIYSLPKDKLPTNHILSWIYSVTKNESISLLRKKKNNISIEEVYDIPDENNEISNSINKIEFKKLISKLDESEKEIVSLKAISGLTFDEISKLLNKPTGTIKWKYYKSIYTLRLLLSNLGMFIVTFVIGLKTMKLTKKGIADYQTNSVEDKTNENNEQESIDESTQYDVANNTSMKERTEEQNTANQNTVKQENDTTKEIQIPIKEPFESINYFSIGIFAISSIFLLFTIILLINYIKYQLKRKVKASK